jgi:hypothetical protein
MRTRLIGLMVSGLFLVNGCGGTSESKLSYEESYAPIYKDYNNWAVCTGEPNLIVRNGPGPDYAVSPKKASCAFGENAYVQGTTFARQNGKLYAKLPGWGDYVDPSDGRRYGYADARWFVTGYKLTLNELYEIVKPMPTCDEAFRSRVFLMTSRTEADNAALMLNGLYALSEKNQAQSTCGTSVSNWIFTVLGTVPVVGNVISIFKTAIEENTVYAGGGKWEVVQDGKFSRVQFISW